jgi:hypothetical protein
MPMQVFSMRLTPATMPEHTSSLQRTSHSRTSMVPFSQSPNHQVSYGVAAKSELAALFVTAREMIPHRQTLISMGWPQPKSPIQTDNSTATGSTNKTIVPCRARMMDMHFWWLLCRASQDQFHYYLDAGSKNWTDYHTKHHLDTYHEAHQSTHAGIWDPVGS